MNDHNSSKSSLFLMELIIAIMFFAIASAVCLRLFAGAHTLSEKDKELGCGLMWSQSLAESFFGCGGDIHEISKLYPNSVTTLSESGYEGSVVILLEDEWQEISGSNFSACYEAIIVIKKDTAENIYSDISDYSVPLTGNALQGIIAIINLKGTNNVFTEIPVQSTNIIYKNSVDFYIGE